MVSNNHDGIRCVWKTAKPAYDTDWKLSTWVSHLVGDGRLWGKVCHFWRLADQRLQLVEEQHPSQPVLPRGHRGCSSKQARGACGLGKTQMRSVKTFANYDCNFPKVQRAQGKGEAERSKTSSSAPPHRRVEPIPVGGEPSVPQGRSEGLSAALRQWVSRTSPNPRFRPGLISLSMPGSGRVRDRSGRRARCSIHPQRSCLRAVSRFTAKGIGCSIVANRVGTLPR